MQLSENDNLLPQYICIICIQKFIEAFEIRRLFLKSDVTLREQVLGSILQNDNDSCSVGGHEIQTMNLDSLVLGADVNVPVDLVDTGNTFTFLDENVLAEALKAPIEGSLSEAAKQQVEISQCMLQELEVQLVVTAEDDLLAKEMDPGDWK